MRNWSNWKNDVGKIQTDIKDKEHVDPQYVMEKLIELEGKSSRNSLRIDGVEETLNKTLQKINQ